MARKDDVEIYTANNAVIENGNTYKILFLITERSNLFRSIFYHITKKTKATSFELEKKTSRFFFFEFVYYQ